MISIIAQLLAGAVLGFAGLLLAGDFRIWHAYRYTKNQVVNGEADAAAALLFLIYVGALAIIRWVH